MLMTEHLPSMEPAKKPLPLPKHSIADVENLSVVSVTSVGLKLFFEKHSYKFQT
jgi:hypothetical protein